MKHETDSCKPPHRLIWTALATFRCIQKVGRGTKHRLGQVGRVSRGTPCSKHFPTSKVEAAMDVILVQELARSDVCCCMEQTKPGTHLYVFIWPQTLASKHDLPQSLHPQTPSSETVDTGSALHSIVYHSNYESLQLVLCVLVRYHKPQSELLHHRLVQHPSLKSTLFSTFNPLVLQAINQQLPSQLQLDQTLSQETIS